MLSKPRTRKPDSEVAALVTPQPLDRLPVSVVTLADIHFGVERMSATGKRPDLDGGPAHRGRPMVERQVLSVIADVMREGRRLVEEGRKAERTFSQPDLILAATVLHRGVTVATRDVGASERAGVPVLDPRHSVPAT